MKKYNSYANLIFVSVSMLAIMALMFIGSCIKVASITDTKYSTVQAKIIDTDRDTSFATYGTGLHTTTTDYITYLEYDGSVYTVNDSKMYHECKDNTGEFIEAELVETYFKDGSMEKSMRPKGD